MGIWAASTFWLLWKWCYKRLCKFLCGCLFSFLVDMYLGIEFLGGLLTLYLTFWELLDCFPKQIHSTFLSAMHDASNFSTSSPYLTDFFIIACWWVGSGTSVWIFCLILIYWGNIGQKKHTGFRCTFPWYKSVTYIACPLSKVRLSSVTTH